MKKIAIPIIIFTLIGLTWECAARLGLYNVSLFPPPSAALSAVVGLWNSGTLQNDLMSSAARYIPGYLIGCLIGVVIGILSGIFKYLGYAVSPLFHYLRSIPPVALIPFSILFFGIDDYGKICLVAWASFFPVWLSTAAGVDQVPKEYIKAARIFRLSTLQRIKDIWLPCSLPYVMGGLRISISTGLFALAAAEMFAASSGIGFRIVHSHQLFHIDEMVGMILLLGLIALLADRVVLIARKVFLPWEEKA